MLRQWQLRQSDWWLVERGEGGGLLDLNLSKAGQHAQRGGHFQDRAALSIKGKVYIEDERGLVYVLTTLEDDCVILQPAWTVCIRGRCQEPLIFVQNASIIIK